LRAPRLLTGEYGVVIEDGAVLIDGDRIVAAGNADAIPRAGDAEEIGFAGATLMPGLIDAHVHVCFRAGEDIVAHPQAVSEEDAYSQAKTAARLVLAAGVTTVRDLGCRGTLAQRLRDAVIDGRADGPRILAAGRPITSPKGHFWSIGIEARGAPALRAAVDDLVGEDVDLIKLIATGGSLTPGTDMGRAQFSLEECTALIEAAHDHHRPVAAHAHASEGIERIIAAGVDTIEHCSWMDHDDEIGTPPPDRLAEMRDNGQMIVIAGPVPDALFDARGGIAQPTGSEPRSVARLLKLWRNSLQARRMGVGTALGTDSLFGQFENGHDLAYRAEALVARAGWSPFEVLEMLGSAGARAVRGTGHIGVLAPGAYADIAVIDGDPATRIADLHRVAAVFLGGTRVA